MSIIWALVKKDFIFNWKTCIGCIIVLPLGLRIELLDDGISQDEILSFIVVLALLCIIPVIHSLDKDNTPSTKQFLSSLPIETKYLILSKIVVLMIYSAATFIILLTSNCIFYFGFSVDHFLAGGILTILGGVGYIYYSYVRNREWAQLFMWCIFIPLMIFVVWVRDTALNLWLKTNLTLFLTVLIVSLLLSVMIVLTLLKKKRRL